MQIACRMFTRFKESLWPKIEYITVYVDASEKYYHRVTIESVVPFKVAYLCYDSNPIILNANEILFTGVPAEIILKLSPGRRFRCQVVNGKIVEALERITIRM